MKKIPRDKQLHTIVSFIIFIASFLLTQEENVSLAIAVLAGAGKEFTDKYIGTGKFEVDDLIADAIGIVTAYLSIVVYRGDLYGFI